MPDNRVNVQFIGDAVSFRDASAQVNGQLQSVSQSTRHAALEMANATQAFSKPRQTLLDLATQAAATGTNLTEAGKRMREAGAAAEELDTKTKNAKQSASAVRTSFSNFARDATGWVVSFLGIASAFEAVRHAIVSGAEVQTAQTRLNAIVGSADQGQKVFGQLGVAAQDSVTNVTKVTEAAIDLYAAGTDLGKVPEQVENLAKVARISGEPLEALVSIFDRIHLRGDVTWRDLIRLGGALGDQTRNLAIQYRSIEPTLQTITAGIKAAQQVSAAWHTQLMQNRSAIADIQDKVGFTSAVFQQWQRDNMLTVQHPFIEGFAGTDVGRLAQDTIGRFREGIKEIAFETKLSENAIAQFVRQGQIGYQELISWSDKYQDRIHKLDQLQLEQTRQLAASHAEEQRLAILQKVEQALTNTTEITRNFAKEQDTAAGKFQKMSFDVEQAFQKVGTEIDKHLDEIKNTVIGLTATIGVFKAIEFAGLIARIGGITAAWDAVTAAANAAGASISSAAAGEIALMATRVGILTAITQAIPGDTDRTNPERKKVLQEEFKKEGEDPGLKQWREEQKQWLDNNKRALIAQGPLGSGDIYGDRFASRTAPTSLDLPRGTPTGSLPTARSGMTPSDPLGQWSGSSRGGLPRPIVHSPEDIAAELRAYRPTPQIASWRGPTDFWRTGRAGEGSVIGIGESLAAVPGVKRYGANDPYGIGPSLPDAPRRPVDPMEAELIRAGNKAGLAAYQAAHHLTQLPGQQGGEDPQLTTLKGIHEEVKGQRADLKQLMSASGGGS